MHGAAWTAAERRESCDADAFADAGHHPGGGCRDPADPMAALLAVSREAVVAYLGKVLPPAMMGLLVVYCLRSISWLSAPHGAPELIAIAAVAGLHLWKRNVLLSIAGGTVLYMVLVQAVFV